MGKRPDRPPAHSSRGAGVARDSSIAIFTRWAKQFDRWLARTQRIEFTPKGDPPEPVSLGPKRGGVSVELVAIVWELG